MLCAVVCFCCQATMFQYCTSVLALTGSTTFNIQWFCLPQCTNASTLSTFIALRQLRCCCLLNCLVIWIHNPSCSVALRRQLPFLQTLITVNCERFSTHLSEPNHVSYCVGPAWLGVGRLTSVQLFKQRNLCSFQTWNRKKFESTVKNIGDSLFEHTFSK